MKYSNSKTYIILFILAIVSSVLRLVLLFLINESILDFSKIRQTYIFTFFIVLIFTFIFDKIFQEKIIDLSNDYIFKKELEIIKTIGNSSFKEFEKIDKGRILGIIEDIRNLVYLPHLISNGLTSTVLFIGGLVYLFLASYVATIVFILIVLFFALGYKIINRINKKIISDARINNQVYFKYLEDFITGIKEISLSKKKKTTLIDEKLLENRTLSRNLEIRVSNLFLLGNLIGSYSIWFLLGIIAFVFPFIGILEVDKTASFIVILLFLSGPVNKLISLQNFAIKISVSLKRMKAFTNELETIKTNGKVDKLINKLDLKHFGTLEFIETTFKYQNSPFSIYPINLKIEEGETVFIIGGNGSGKSTFIKLLLSLYSPTSGEILINKQPVNNFGQNYRELFSPIFTKNHLFSEHYEDYNIETNEAYNHLLKKMKLDSIIQENENVTKRTFSKGQGKRLSMIYALLENRPVLVLDEWAADQDPHFRKYFYEELIPELKSQGKTIIAVTHDDAYFKYADRILKFEYGKIVKDVYTKNRKSLNELNVW
ncbi:cyclic peptide export ABC transporter [Tenacibaculum piscium]|uniref:cyclic peptide export ABC transporter n=1 Tax=Tenacibaculum piscium TaxID=1458515 RepID=UPI001F1D07F9|nr:cyclic peptide export ABC transporter [Tenacibaculum piscium]